MGECQPVLGQLAGMEVSRGNLHKVPAVHLKAETLGPRVLGVKEVMLDWFNFVKLKPEENEIQVENGIRTRVTSAIPVVYQLSYQANLELVTL